MCRRYRLTRPDLLAATFDAAPPFKEFTEMGKTVPLQFKPGDYVLIVHQQGRRRVIDVAHWGFIPSWASADAKVMPIHARSETAADSGMFRSAFQSWRCLIPADGFSNRTESPVCIRRPDHSIFAFAGLWSYRDDSQTCAMLTITSNRTVAPLQDRMPVIIAAKDYRKWLDPTTRMDEVHRLLQPCADDALVIESETP